MARLTKNEAEELILIFEEHKARGKDHVLIKMATRFPEMIASVNVYYSNISRCSEGKETRGTMSTYLRDALNSFYNGGVTHKEARDDNLMRAIDERNEWKAKAEELQARLDKISYLSNAK